MRARPRSILALLALVVLATTAIAVADARPRDGKKVTICHRVGGPHYVAITIAAEAVLSGHAKNHPLDVIPAFTYAKGQTTTAFPGQNLTEEGVAVLGNGCVAPRPPAEPADAAGGGPGPGGGSEDPGGGSGPSGGGSDNPGGGSENPGGGSDNPGGGSENPGGGSENPGGGSDNPGGGSDNPGGGSENPGGGSDNPGGGSDNPGGGSDTPGGGSENPGGGPDAAGSGSAVTLCHAVGRGAYREEALDPEQVVAEHLDDPGDIIPAFAYGDGGYFAGRNLSEAGARILVNGCRGPEADAEPVPGAPTLEVRKTATDEDGRRLAAGDVVRFAVTVTNAGDIAAHAVEVVDAIPAGTEYVVGSATTADGLVEVRGGYLTAYLGDGATDASGGVLAPGASATVAFSARVLVDLPPGAVVLNQALATGTDPNGVKPVEVESNPIELPVAVAPPVPAVLDVTPPADPPAPGGDVVVVVTSDPTRDVADVTACVTIEIPPVAGGRFPLGLARTACAPPVDAPSGRAVRRGVRIAVPRVAAGRCVRLVTRVTAEGYRGRERSQRVCVRALPSGPAEPVTG